MPDLHATAAGSTMSTERLDDLRAQARYARERYQLYKAKSYGPRPTSTVRMRELQRTWEQAEGRLHAAEADRQPPTTPRRPAGTS
jgi:hypothetical protein